MADGPAPVSFEIGVDQASLAEANRDLDTFFGGIADKLTPTVDVVGLLQTAWNGVAGAIGFAGEQLSDAFDASLEGERVNRQLAAALRMSGREVDLNVERLGELANAFERTTNVEAEQIGALQKQAIALGVLPDQLDDVIEASIGWAQIMDKDVGTALLDVIKTTEGTLPKSLKKLRPEIQTTGEAMGFMASGMALATSEAESMEGRLKGLEIALGNLQEETGGIISGSSELAGLIGDIRTEVEGLTDELVESKGPAGEAVDVVFGGMRTAFAWIIDHGDGVVNVLGRIGQTLTGPVGSVFGAARDMWSLLGGGGTGEAPPAAGTEGIGANSPMGLDLAGPPKVDKKGKEEELDWVKQLNARWAAEEKAAAEHHKLELEERNAVDAVAHAEFMAGANELMGFLDVQVAKQASIDKMNEDLALARSKARQDELGRVQGFGGQLKLALHGLAAELGDEVQIASGIMQQFGAALGQGIAQAAVGVLVEGQSLIEATSGLFGGVLQQIGATLSGLGGILLLLPGTHGMGAALLAAGVTASVLGAAISRGGKRPPSTPSIGGGFAGGGRSSGAGFGAFDDQGSVPSSFNGATIVNRTTNLFVGAGAVITDSRRELGKLFKEASDEWEELRA